MNDPKPILALGVNGTPTVDLLHKINKESEEKFNDYHVLVYPRHELPTKIEVFHCKDFKESEFETMKSDIMNIVKNIK